MASPSPLFVPHDSLYTASSTPQAAPATMPNLKREIPQEPLSGAAKRPKNVFDDHQIVVTFKVGAEFTPKLRKNNNKNNNKPAVPVSLFAIKANLFFGDHELGGRLLDLKHGGIIALPRLNPKNVQALLKNLTSLDGQQTTFSHIDNLLHAFEFATAIEDDTFQNAVIERIHTNVKNKHHHKHAAVREELVTDLVEAIKWAFREKSRLQGLLVMCLGWALTKRTMDKKSMKEDHPHLDLTGLNNLVLNELIRYPWYGLFWTEFGKQMRFLHDVNEDRGWVQVPVHDYEIKEPIIIDD